eukprot:Gb_02611 [translate_table: standard]
MADVAVMQEIGIMHLFHFQGFNNRYWHHTGEPKSLRDIADYIEMIHLGDIFDTSDERTEMM